MFPTESRTLYLDEDAECVLEVINEAGVLPFDDKASPEVIQRVWS